MSTSTTWSFLSSCSNGGGLSKVAKAKKLAIEKQPLAFAVSSASSASSQDDKQKNQQDERQEVSQSSSLPFTNLITATSRRVITTLDGTTTLNVELYEPSSSSPTTTRKSTTSSTTTPTSSSSLPILFYIHGICESAETISVQRIFQHAASLSTIRVAVIELEGHGLSSGQRGVCTDFFRLVQQCLEVMYHLVVLDDTDDGIDDEDVYYDSKGTGTKEKTNNISTTMSVPKFAISGTSLGGVIAIYVAEILSRWKQLYNKDNNRHNNNNNNSDDYKTNATTTKTIPSNMTSTMFYNSIAEDFSPRLVKSIKQLTIRNASRQQKQEGDQAENNETANKTITTNDCWLDSFLGVIPIVPAVGVNPLAIPPKWMVTGLSIAAYCLPTSMEVPLTPIEDPTHYNCPRTTKRNFDGYWPLITSKMLLDITSKKVQNDSQTNKLSLSNVPYVMFIAGSKDDIVPWKDIQSVFNNVISSSSSSSSTDDDEVNVKTNTATKIGANIASTSNRRQFHLIQNAGHDILVHDSSSSNDHSSATGRVLQILFSIFFFLA